MHSATDRRVVKTRPSLQHSQHKVAGIGVTQPAQLSGVVCRGWLVDESYCLRLHWNYWIPQRFRRSSRLCDGSFCSVLVLQMLEMVEWAMADDTWINTLPFICGKEHVVTMDTAFNDVLMHTFVCRVVNKWIRRCETNSSLFLSQAYIYMKT